MSPHDMEPYQEKFDKACELFGWKKEVVEKCHERDEGCSWTEDVWVDANGKYLFEESDLSEGMVQELIRIVYPYACFADPGLTIVGAWEREYPVFKDGGEHSK